MGFGMSFQAMAWAVKQTAPTKAKFLLIMLANYADDRGHCWPSIKTLCVDTGIPRSTLKLYLDRLVKLGLIEKAKRSKGVLQTSNLYVLRLG
jgi:DNA-binding IclR family transcriptional regulator